MSANEKSISEEQLKKNRRAAVILGISTGIALISIVFGFVQKGVADENLKVSERSMMMADSLRVQLRHCHEMDELNKKIAEMANARADSLSNLSKKKK